ncbi:MAG: ABC transporter substrate-binding protein [Paracoccus sp. (in: a-proteobacteria)]|uniref:ABC transporter substrate-binding protein n=1 Tax=Paracoccus sp. TaxID=267 RepID=UPI0026DEF455|nr:ABC transporter substrate-binding protein [Paracoccus sp. (in: a-proteobacteria)]MDO5622794.1 ABC transporter substrate-binding protein [Paracoccus sp. (in: a-proteobacteria)]
MAHPVAAEMPRRVVSMNLCTDQLALLIAAPGQVVSVSYLAADPRVSLMADHAAAIGVNHGLAEEIYLLNPDLVLAGTYTTRATVDMLTRLGQRVESLPPAGSIEDIRAAILHMGVLLGQNDRAAQVLADFDAAMIKVAPGAGRLAATYGANGWTAGGDTLAGDIMRAAGLELLADRQGRAHGGSLPLEDLVMAAPELLVTAARYAQPSRAEAVLDHPAIAALTARRMTIADRDWVCGLPHVAEVAARLAR